MVKLRPMSAREFEDFIAWAKEDYAKEQIKAGAWSEEQASELSAQTFAKQLPDGLETPSNNLFIIERAEDGQSIGYLWWASHESGKKRFGTLNDIVIFEAHRRHGYGHLALQAMEKQMKAMGLEEIYLHVFGHNQAARALYQKMDYVERNITMVKTFRSE